MTTPPFAPIADALARYHKFYITTHVGPDGDAIGSALALKLALEGMGKEAVYVCRDGVPASCRYLPRTDGVLTAPPPGFVAECAIVLDCDGTPSRVASPYEPIAAAPFKILIDHHRTSEPIFDVNWIHSSEPATAMMIYKLLDVLKCPITADMAQCLLCGISTDTGHFRFAATSPAIFQAAGDLVRFGADPAETSFRLFDERSFASTQLLGLSLFNMQSESDGELVYTALAFKDFSTIGTGDESSENVVNYLRNVKGCRMAIIFRERKDDEGSVTRISVRADPALRADLFCNQYGGGGHAAAAGCRERGPFDEVVKKVVKNATEWLGGNAALTIALSESVA